MRGRWCRWRGLGIAAVLCGALGACGSGRTQRAAGGTSRSGGVPSATSSAARRLSPARYLGPITSPATYPNLGIDLAPPPAGSLPSTSWEAAYRNCLTGKAECATGGGPDISLAQATTPAAGARRRDGSINPLVRGTLSYVLTWTGVPCVPTGGGPAVSGRPSSSPKVYSCIVVDLIDADTGELLYAASGTSG